MVSATTLPTVQSATDPTSKLLAVDMTLKAQKAKFPPCSSSNLGCDKCIQFMCSSLACQLQHVTLAGASEPRAGAELIKVMVTAPRAQQNFSGLKVGPEPARAPRQENLHFGLLASLERYKFQATLASSKSWKAEIARCHCHSRV